MDDDVDVIVVGAGFAGIGMAASALRAGFSALVLEKAWDVGGVWRDNTYPGAACDVPSSLYSFSFAPEPGWPRRYSGQADIHAYLRRVAAETGVLPRVRFGAEVVSADYDESAARWRITLADGREHVARFLVTAVGQLSRPAVPDLPGAADYPGRVFHSSRWDHDLDLTGLRVAVVGAGASAIQFVPEIRRVAARVTVFQRTPPHVIPKPDRAYTRWHTALYRAFPPAQAVGRATTWVAGEFLTAAITAVPAFGKAVEAAFHLHLRRQVADPALRAALVPDHPVGCQRVLFSNTWYPALTSDNVDLVTSPAAGFTSRGLRSADGVEHPVDVVVHGTGFAATEFLVPVAVRGRGGALLADRWRDGARAHLGLTVPGFPNLFVLYGPNTNLGGNSVLQMVEPQVGYVTTLLERMRAHGLSSAEVRPEVADAFDREVQDRLGRTAWARCRSWYRVESGRIVSNWPGQVWEYRRRTARPDPRHFRFTRP
ncbi:NAD(P)/FAD-dependent oxidoreductase [Actinosynnema pretiosum subsp. pretiosum]|uniref:NAD(P)/FAD-dependent oxidoreductase n=1 Tax=Actinosynnema pretiosum subsp. pretiosum TaxID=103721 RepID=A0AA45L7Q3_9PSEU|nr:Cyclohexanone monooxygenase [Actinosynnema pretiosum subsp. pretiosum]QUF04852.1 NAD(P)/FAD-dependent oxidoreductase [Actinosynnema pretiosum subsp. pretiosum]